MSTASVYGATFVKAEVIGTDQHGNTRYRITYRTSDDVEHSANTRGRVRDEVASCYVGDRVTLIRDRRGSITVVENTTR